MVKLQDVFKTYDNGTKALRGVSLTIQDGEFVFIVGPSGSGKSTIIKMLTAELRPTSGKVQVGDYDIGSIRQRDIPYLRRTIGVVFQDFRLIENKTVYENVAFVMRAVGAPQSSIKKRVTYVLDLQVNVISQKAEDPGDHQAGADDGNGGKAGEAMDKNAGKALPHEIAEAGLPHPPFQAFFAHLRTSCRSDLMRS